MAQQLKKKFIGNDQVDGDKILLESGQALVAKDSLGVEQELIKLGASDEVLVKGQEVALKDESAARDLSNLQAGSADINIDTSANVNISGANLNLEGQIYSANGIAFSSTGASTVVLNGFDVFDYSGQGSPAKSSDVALTSGSVTDSSLTIQDVDSGSVSIVSGNVSHGVGDSGSISLSTGSSVSGSRGAIILDGSNVNVSGKQIKNIADGTANTDAVSVQQLDSGLSEKVSKSGDSMTGSLSFSGTSSINLEQGVVSATIPDYAATMGPGTLEISNEVGDHYTYIDGGIISLRTWNTNAPKLPTADEHVAVKKYVDDEIASISSGSIAGLQSELDDTQLGAGLGTDGSYSAPVGSNYLGSAVSLKDADNKLDAQIKVNADDIISLDGRLDTAESDITALENEDLTFLKLDGSRPMEANLNMMEGLVHHKIIGLGDPTDARDAVNKQYVDAIAEGLHVHAPAKALANASLASITGGSVTYANGSSGVGATLTLGVALTALDGYSLQNGDRIIINGESNQAHNGIYTWATGGTVLTRAVDFDEPVEAAGGDFIFVQEGTLYGNTGWVMTETTSAIGTSPIAFVQFSGAGTYTAGDALSLDGTEFNVKVQGDAIAINGSNELYLKLDGSSLSIGASGLKSNIVWDKAYFDLTATDISNGYVDFPAGVIAEAGSIIGFVDRLAIHEDEDFIVSTVSGKTRITFAGDLVTPGQSALDATDNLYFKFQKKVV